MRKLVRSSSRRRRRHDSSTISSRQRRDVIIRTRMGSVVHVSTRGLTVSRRIRRVVTLKINKTVSECSNWKEWWSNLLVGCSWVANMNKGWLMTIVPLGNSWLPVESSWLSGLARLSCSLMGSMGKSNLTLLLFLCCTGSTLHPQNQHQTPIHNFKKYNNKTDRSKGARKQNWTVSTHSTCGARCTAPSSTSDKVRFD